MDIIRIIADSSFYICFLDDIKDLYSLIEILIYKYFKFIIGIVVKKEIKESDNYHLIEESVDSYTDFFSEVNYGELLRPLFSKEELKKGENEAITISYILFDLDYEFITILDDDESRKFFISNLYECADNLTGTVGFIGDCVYTYNIFKKEKGISILIAIKNSKFRIQKLVIDKIINKIKES